MQLTELISMLQRISETHPNTKVVEAFTKDGKASHQIGIHVRKNVIIIQGEHV